jgi:hypothetical protein
VFAGNTFIAPELAIKDLYTQLSWRSFGHHQLSFRVLVHDDAGRRIPVSNTVARAARQRQLAW